MPTTPATEATGTARTREALGGHHDRAAAKTCTADNAGANDRRRSQEPHVGARSTWVKKIAGDVSLWILQMLLGLFFAGSGFGKVLMVDDRLYSRAPDAVAWYAAVPQPLIVFIGVCEVLGGLGLILPSLSRIKTGLTPLASAGLGVTMILATGFHVNRSELGLAAVTLGLATVTCVVAIGRGRLRPLNPKPRTAGRAALTLAVLVAVLVFVFVPTWYVMTNAQF